MLYSFNLLSVGFTADGTGVFTCGRDGKARLTAGPNADGSSAPNTATRLRDYTGHSGTVTGLTVTTDGQGNALVNDKGMSVAPEWRDLPIFFIPPRLGTGGRGKNSHSCFRRGTGAFQQGPCGNGLELVPDSPVHGVVRPDQVVPLADYLKNLADTREEWEIDEN